MSDDASDYRIRGEETWGAARAAYAGGLSAPEVCERFGLGLSTFRARARQDGWRRSDEADPAPDLDESDDLDASEGDPDLSPAQLAELALRQTTYAILRGRLREAQGWTRVHREWRALAVAGQPAPGQPAPGASQARSGRPADTGSSRAPETKTARDEVHDLHDLHHDFEASADVRPLNRGDRRKQARLTAWKARQATRGP